MAGASGSKWNTTNDYGTAVDCPNNHYQESGLTCGTQYTRYFWAYNPCGSSAPTTLSATTLNSVPILTEGVHSSTTTSITWNWSVSGGAGTTVKFNTVNNLATATDLGNGQSYTETGLSLWTHYTRYVWATNPCGTTSVKTYQHGTSPGPGSPETVDYEGVTYHTIMFGIEGCWNHPNQHYQPH